MPTTLRLVLIAALAGALLSACGGHGSVSEPPPSANNNTELPQRALSDVDGLVTWTNDQITNHTSKTSEPVVLGDVTLPTSDTREPI